MAIQGVDDEWILEARGGRSGLKTARQLVKNGYGHWSIWSAVRGWMVETSYTISALGYRGIRTICSITIALEDVVVEP
jgi:hypothetical protein